MKHKHNWEVFRSDRTGGFVRCKKCNHFAFLSKWSMYKFRKMLRDGYTGREIWLSPADEGRKD